ncbi:MAG: quinone oxidoreductase family protein [Candidatus Hodarchaeales archaeon]|jgi:NADPH2:quinone reductase
MKSIQIYETGVPNNLILKDVPEVDPKPNEVKVKINYAGINFIDIYYRKGVYKRELPFTPGEEGAGIVTEVGKSVENFSIGDKVVYCMVGGSYSEFHCVPENKVVKIPDYLDTKFAASSMLQGLTAHYLTNSTYSLKPGNKVVIHAASGGVGLLLVQMAKLLGAEVIAVTSTEEKTKIVRDMGADYVFNYQNFQEETLKEVGRVNAVYDSVGKTTFNRSLDILKPRGYLILYGQSSGVVEPVNPGILAQKGSLFLTRPSLGHYILDSKELNNRAKDLFEWIRSKKLKITIDSVFPLEKAHEAHNRLENRLNIGKVLLKIK